MDQVHSRDDRQYRHLPRTFSTIHARIGTRPHVTTSLLNDKTGMRTAIQRIYDRHMHLPEMRAAMARNEAQVNDLFTKNLPDAIKSPESTTTV